MGAERRRVYQRPSGRLHFALTRRISLGAIGRVPGPAQDPPASRIKFGAERGGLAHAPVDVPCAGRSPEGIGGRDSGLAKAEGDHGRQSRRAAARVAACLASAAGAQHPQDDRPREAAGRGEAREPADQCVGQGPTVAAPNARAPRGPQPDHRDRDEDDSEDDEPCREQRDLARLANGQRVEEVRDRADEGDEQQNPGRRDRQRPDVRAGLRSSRNSPRLGAGSHPVRSASVGHRGGA